MKKLQGRGFDRGDLKQLCKCFRIYIACFQAMVRP
jgi:hypothetical protein